MSRIGFIGLGNMGAPMARNLLKAGFSVTAHDLAPAPLAALVADGAAAAGSAADCAREAEIVVTALPAARHVRACLLGESGDDGVFAAAKAGAVFVDCSTIDPESARAFAQAAEARGLAYLDAPMSGGVGGAAAGTLTFMVGGAESALATARPVLEAMGANIFHAGDSGAGAAAKICNNMLLAISMIGVCEAFTLAKSVGLDAQKLYDISSTATGRCWSLNEYCPAPGPVPTAPSNRDYAPGFAAELMLKDLRLAMSAAQASGAATPLGAHATQIYALMDAAGGAGLDFSGVIKLLSGELGGRGLD